MDNPVAPGHAKPGEYVDHVLAEAREALADASDVLLTERAAQANRDAAADRRDRAADTREKKTAGERDLALQARRGRGR